MSTICTNCKNNPCVMSCEEKTKCPDYDEGKPVAYNYVAAERRIKELERQLKHETELWNKLAEMNDELAKENARLKSENKDLRASIGIYDMEETE